MPSNQAYHQSLILLLAIIAGHLFGALSGDWVIYVKPFSQIFLNILICVMLPFVFFSISHAVAKMQSHGEFGRLFGVSLITFLILGICVCLFSIFSLTFFPVKTSLVLQGGTKALFSLTHFLNKCVEMFSVDNFDALWSSQHLLALMLFAILFGISVSKATNHQKIIAFLEQGEQLFKGMFDLVMYFAPLAFFSYFANLTHDIGSNLFSAYFSVGLSYYLTALLYFTLGFSTIIAFSKGAVFLKTFWKNISLPAMMALGTCSSVACIPINIDALKKMGCQESIAESILPLGTLIHKQGSIIGGLFKIAFLMTVYHLDFSGLSILSLAVIVSILVGTVMGAIPGGGMLGELLILSVYGFPKEALMLVATISLIIDPLATVLNVTGNTLSCIVIDAYLKPKKEK